MSLAEKTALSKKPPRKPDAKELAEYEAEAMAWFKENTPKDPGFMLPLTFMEVGTDQQFEFLVDWQNKVYEAGYLGASWPVEYGGGGLHPNFQRVATRAMRAFDGPIILNAIGIGWARPLILEMGTEEEKHKYIKGMLSAEDIWCQGFSEPDNGSDLGNAQLSAVRQGDEYLLNGSKIWTSLGDRAKYMILLARTSKEEQSKYAGLSFFLAPMDAPGISTRPIQKLTGEYGFVQCFFDNARIPADCIMGREGDGWRIAMRTLEYERGAKVNPAGGYYMKELDALAIVGLAQEARRGGKPLLDDPIMRDKMVEQMMEIQALNLNNQRRRMMPLNSDRPMGLSMLNKLSRTEMIREMTQMSLQFLGTKSGYYIDEPEAVDNGYWHRAYLNSFSATIGGGTSEIQRNIVAEHVLGLPKSK